MHLLVLARHFRQHLIIAILILEVIQDLDQPLKDQTIYLLLVIAIKLGLTKMNIVHDIFQLEQRHLYQLINLQYQLRSLVLQEHIQMLPEFAYRFVLQVL